MRATHSENTLWGAIGALQVKLSKKVMAAKAQRDKDFKETSLTSAQPGERPEFSLHNPVPLLSFALPPLHLSKTNHGQKMGLLW